MEPVSPLDWRVGRGKLPWRTGAVRHAVEPLLPRGQHAASNAAGEGAVSRAVWGSVRMHALEVEGAMVQLQEWWATAMDAVRVNGLALRGNGPVWRGERGAGAERSVSGSLDE